AVAIEAASRASTNSDTTLPAPTTFVLPSRDTVAGSHTRHTTASPSGPAGTSASSLVPVGDAVTTTCTRSFGATSGTGNAPGVTNTPTTGLPAGNNTARCNRCLRDSRNRIMIEGRRSWIRQIDDAARYYARERTAQPLPASLPDCSDTSPFE